VTGVGEDLEQARALAYEGAAAISFDGARYRSDVAQSEATRVPG
jgi:phosphoribosylamine-glycine ligase